MTRRPSRRLNRQRRCRFSPPVRGGRQTVISPLTFSSSRTCVFSAVSHICSTVIESRLAAPRATIRAAVRAAAARALHSNPAAPALLDPKRHALTVGVGDLQVRDLEHPEARAVGDAERRQGEIPAKGAQARAGDTRAGCPHIRMSPYMAATIGHRHEAAYLRNARSGRACARRLG